ncbi:MAG: hypothetical protein A3J29_17235 [Acidobacteria bacterium RIFCSPLOWO2_12_FULL_67_14b]|nr:MAG: hypothetical protein A3J29_17235 [Acidobacteria bacterium RIFCSPLOWO2_12_FULL_67_14b]
MIIGSQAVLGQFPHAPETLLVSLDADVFPRYAPDKSDLIDGAIGELSMFHEMYEVLRTWHRRLFLPAGRIASYRSVTRTRPALSAGVLTSTTWLSQSSSPEGTGISSSR